MAISTRCLALLIASTNGRTPSSGCISNRKAPSPNRTYLVRMRCVHFWHIFCYTCSSPRQKEAVYACASKERYSPSSAPGLCRQFRRCSEENGQGGSARRRNYTKRSHLVMAGTQRYYGAEFVFWSGRETACTARPFYVCQRGPGGLQSEVQRARPGWRRVEGEAGRRGQA